MYQPLLIADSGGTKTDWCYVDDKKRKHFFTSESYHPANWSDKFIKRIEVFWSQYPQYKSANLLFFCSGCLKVEKSNELTSIFQKIGFSNVLVKSDLHAAGLSLLGNENGNVAILGTGSVFFEWRNSEVHSIIGGKGFEVGDEGSGFYFGKLVYQAYQKNMLTSEQKQVFERNSNILEIDKAVDEGRTKEMFSQIPNQLKEHKSKFSNFHEENIRLFFEPILSQKNILSVRVIGGYFAAHSSILVPFLLNRGIEIEQFSQRPIDALVDYLVCFTE